MTGDSRDNTYHFARFFVFVSVLLASACKDASRAQFPVTLSASDVTVGLGERVHLSWSAPVSALCIAPGLWDGQQTSNGSWETPPLEAGINVLSVACSGENGSGRASVLVRVQNGESRGLDFPGSQATEGTIRFQFLDPLPMYPATYIWQIKLRSQAEYYTTFFWGNDGEFRWDTNRFPNSYYGAHPYPSPAPNFVPADQVGPRYWEIAVAGLDVLSEQEVEYGRWHTQALRVWSDILGKHHEFYWDLPDTSRVIKNRQPRSYGNKSPPKPTLTWGDAPWAPSKEIMDGVIRGIQIYTSKLSIADIRAEIDEPLSTANGSTNIWYLNLNPTPTDISDKSGSGNHPQWVGTERPTLWAAAGEVPKTDRD